MNRWTKRGREALNAKTDHHPNLVAFLDGHRLAYFDRHETTATLRTFCKATITIEIAQLFTPEMNARAAKVLTCDACQIELDRLDTLRRTDPAAHANELDRLFVEGRSETPS